MSARRSFQDHRLFAGFLPPLRQPLADRPAGHDVVLVIVRRCLPTMCIPVAASAPGDQLFHLTDDPEQPPALPWEPACQCTIQSDGAIARQISQVNRTAPKTPATASHPVGFDPISGEFAMHDCHHAAARIR